MCGKRTNTRGEMSVTGNQAKTASCRQTGRAVGHGKKFTKELLVSTVIIGLGRALQRDLLPRRVAIGVIVSIIPIGAGMALWVSEGLATLLRLEQAVPTCDDFLGVCLLSLQGVSSGLQH